jgi:FMN phosphatase YigB (HAD superfamily)
VQTDSFTSRRTSLLHTATLLLHTELRKAGLHLAARTAGVDPELVVEPGFALWHSIRNDVEHLLFPGVVPTLRALQQRGIRLCAITNGNADTAAVPALASLFEFCITAEQVRFLNYCVVSQRSIIVR